MSKRSDIVQADLHRPFPRVQLKFELPSRTRQSETAATDLNSIVSRYQRAGQLPPSQLQFGDATELPTSRLEAMQLLEAAAAAFVEEIPFKVRQAINHDPRLLEQWISANPQQAIEYGLLSQKDPQASSPPSPASSGTDEGKKERKAPSKAPEAGESA